MERKKRSKGRGWESCYVKKNYGMFGVEMRAYGQKLVKFCNTQTHRRVSFSSIDKPVQSSAVRLRVTPLVVPGRRSRDPKTRKRLQTT